MGPTPYQVVISGISGKYPNCRNVQEFKEKLFAKEVLLIPDEKRWNPAEKDKPYMTGKIPDVDKFDCSFFGVTSKLARYADPVLGSTLEVSTEAMVDAGMNPYSLKGRNVGVIVASSLTDAEILRCYESIFPDGNLAMMGLARTMFANRLSYAFNFTGPSYNMDSSWVSAVQALEVAAADVGSGLVEAVVVTCVNLTFHNSLEQEYRDIDADLISQSDKCSPFDVKADGFLRSEGTISFFIQREEDAKRVYCNVLNTQTRCIHEIPSSFTKIPPSLETFLKNFYEETKVNPKDISYVETFGFCNKDRDAQEVNAVANVFCKERASPLLIGCGTGNYGNSETSSSFMSLVKVILAVEEGVIPPTLNYARPNPDVQGLVTGQLKPVTEATKLPGDLVAVNAMSFSGNVAHTLLRQNNKTKRPLKKLPEDGLPRLCILQARHEEGINSIAQKIVSLPVDAEFVSMVNDVFKMPVPHYLWRAYAVVPGVGDAPVLETKELDGVKKPLWLVFSGMGSSWNSMGRELLNIPIFASAINECDRHLRPMGVDIKEILSSDDPSMFDNILHNFVGIAAVQIGLVNCLRSLGVEADGVIGHSAGETCCAYADGCLTLEETILAAYYRGKASLENLGSERTGMMAAVGLGYEAIKNKLPPSVDVACHNAADSCTISGPKEDVESYVADLKSKGVFAKLVNASGIAYHSRYIKSFGPALKGFLTKLIKSPKTRSSKWISTSVPESQWETPQARICSAEYLTNNLLNPVYFEEGCKHIPKNAIVVEVAPHGLLQAILRRSLAQDTVVLSLTNRTAASNLHHFLGAIGKLHLNNVEVDVNALYPTTDYPVSRGTPPLSTLVTWDHEEMRLEEFYASIKSIIRKNALEKKISVNARNEEFELWRHHRVDDFVALPLMQLLMYPWKMIFADKGLKMELHSLLLEDVVISDNVSLAEIDSEIPLLVTFAPASLTFEVSKSTDRKHESGGKCFITGKLQETKTSVVSVPILDLRHGEVDKIIGSEVYNKLLKYGFKLGPPFQVIKQVIMGENECLAKIKWTSDIIVFVDALFKFLTYLQIENDPSSSYLPTSFIRFLVHQPLLTALPHNSEIHVYYDRRVNRLFCEFAELIGVTFKPTPFEKNDCLVWRELQFQPYFDSNLSLNEFLHSSLQLVRQADLGSWMTNPPPLHLLVVNADTNGYRATLESLQALLHEYYQLYEYVSEVHVEEATKILQGSDQRYLVICDPRSAVTLAQTSPRDTFYCISVLNSSHATDSQLKPIFSCCYQDGKLALLKKINTKSPVIVTLEGNDWLERLRKSVWDCTSSQTLVMVTRTLVPRHVLPILAREPYASLIKIFFIQQTDTAQFSTTSGNFYSQLSLGLTVNKLCGGVWGTLRYVNVDIDPKNNMKCLFNRNEYGIEIDYVGLNPPTFGSNNNLDLKELRCADFSGRSDGQERVMGVAHVDGERIIPDPTLRWIVPSNWSLEDATTVPVTYGLAYYCLKILAEVDEGETVLVQQGVGPLGEAVISVALGAGASVITAVENKDEEKLLLQRFPRLDPRHIIMKSSHQDIDIPVRKLGESVEVIVNFSNGRETQSLLKLMSRDSRFIQLAHVTVEDREKMGMFVFIKPSSLSGITAERLIKCGEEEKAQIQRAIQEGIKKGDVRPLKRRVFSTHSRSEVFNSLESKNMVYKTILCRKQSPNRKNFRFNPEEYVVITGTSNGFWLDVASWVVDNGGKYLIVLTTENTMKGINSHHVNKIISCQNCTLVFYPLSTFASLQDGVEMLEELANKRPIDSLICLNMDESSKIMRNLDLASRKAVPKLREFLLLLGEGGGVSESRTATGLPVCCVQTSTLHNNSHKVLPYLWTLLSYKSITSRILVVEDTTQTSLKLDIRISQSDVQPHLPGSVAELEFLSSNMSETHMQEVTSRCPRMQYVKHQLLPVFVIPGISNTRINKLTQQLLHPVFCPTLVPSLPTTEECATYLLEQVTKIQAQGPYNIVAESWGGVVALHLASLLEDRGHQVAVFLLGATPSLSRSWASIFRNPSGLFDTEMFLACSLGSQENVPKGINGKSWDEQIGLLLQHLQSSLQAPPTSLAQIGQYLTVLKTRLTDIMDYKPKHLKDKVKVHLIQTREISHTELTEISKTCQKRPQIHVMEDETLKDVIKNPKTAAVINENTFFSWKF